MKWVEKILFICILILAMSFSAVGQVSETEDAFVDSLKYAGIEEYQVLHYLVFPNSRLGLYYENDNLDCQKTPPFIFHVFWKQNEHVYYKRIDSCGDFEITELEESLPQLNIKRLKNDKLIFHKQNAHFSRYSLQTKTGNEEISTVRSGEQLHRGSGYASKYLNRLVKFISELELKYDLRRIK